jgi:hypothetical protein
MLPLLALAGLAAAGGVAKGLFSGGGMMGKPEQIQQIQNFTPEQRSALNQLLSQGMQDTDFNAIENREVNRFNTQTIPSLAERFTAMGGSGQRSSGFQDALGRAGAGLGEGLASLRSQYGMQKLGMGLTPQFQSVMRPRQPGGIEQGLGSIMDLLPMLSYMNMQGGNWFGGKPATPNRLGPVG